ncbi:MAG: hypothetical protein IKU26_07560 [Clostridia bacterium]|nr:hypothetical protein [Clostridia bacterium]
MGKKLLALLFALAMCLSFAGGTSALATESPAHQVRPDTWVAVDGLGRTLSGYGEVGGTRENKTVGMFFHNWHDYWSGVKPMNITEILAQYPEARNDYDHPAWENSGNAPCFWNEPIWGYYRTTDPYVLRKQAELFADAGVDVLVLDLTNGAETFKTGYDALFKEFQKAKAEGVNVPQIMFFLNPYINETDDAAMITQIKDLYNNIYKDGKYRDLWFYWEGKPLIIARDWLLNKNDATEKAIYELFTFRNPAAGGYYGADTKYADNEWTWCTGYPNAKLGVRKDGTIEQMCVSVAQNYDQNYTGKDFSVGLIAMNDRLNRAQGRGYAKGNYSYQYTYANQTITVNMETKDAYLYGLNIQQQWDYVIECDPDFLLVTGWNELIAQRHETWQGTENGFPDNFNDEYSRDIEPSKGILKDHYYYQLVENVRRYKGAGKPETASAEKNVNKTIDIHSTGDQWADITLSYDHYTGSTQERKYPGYAGKIYKYDTMRNDIVTSKVAYDETYIYFMVETKDDLSASSDAGWMRLLIDTDSTGVSANWEGFEYILNRVSPSGNDAVIERSKGGWDFEQVGTAQFSVSGKRLQIAVPRSAVGLTDLSRLSFNFKWADNTLDPETKTDSSDIMDYYLYGDVAPGGRFMFGFDTEEVTYVPPVNNNGGQGLPGYVWIVVAASAVLIAAMAVVVAVAMRKKQ